MANLKFVRGEEIHLFPFRDKKTDIHALKLNDKYIDLTTNINLTSFSNFKGFEIENTIYYLRDRYFNDSGISHSGIYTNKAYKPSRPVTHNVSVHIDNYLKYKIAINGNFDAMSFFDHNNNSWNSISYFRGNFSDPVKPINSGGKHGGHYYPSGVSEPDGFDMSYPVESMNGEINLTGNISDLTSSDKEIFYRQMTNSIGDGTAVIFRVYVKVVNNELVITYGWWVTGYDSRCTGYISSSIKIGAVVYE